MFQRGSCASFIWDQTKQTINVDNDKTAELIIWKTEDKQFWFDFITTHDSHDVNSLYLTRRVCNLDQTLITMFKQHMNTDLTASTPSVTLNFYKSNEYGMFQPCMVFCRNYKAFMIFQPWRTHKSTAALPVYIPQSITASVNSGVEPQRRAIPADSAGIESFVLRRSQKHNEFVCQLVKSPLTLGDDQIVDASRSLPPSQGSICGFMSSLVFSIKLSTAPNLSLVSGTEKPQRKLCFNI